MINQYRQDKQQAQERAEFYQHCQRLFKGKNAESAKVYQFMQFEYLPRSIRKLVYRIVDAQ